MNKAYNVEINVGQRYLFFDYTLASSSLKVNITSMWFSFWIHSICFFSNISTEICNEKKIKTQPNVIFIVLKIIAAMLNGEIHLSQNGAKIKSTNISTEVPLEYKLEIRKEDFDSIANASSTVVHWFVDCKYFRQTKEFKTQLIFPEPNKTHRIEALAEASFEPATTKTAPTLNSKLISDWRSQHNSNWPYVCNNKSKIIPNPNKIYGYFESSLTAFGKTISTHFIGISETFLSLSLSLLL